MNTTRIKISKIADELFTFFFSAGSQSVDISIQKCPDGYELRLFSGYSPEHRKKIQDLNRFLNVQEKNVGLEETYWELAGMSTLGQDSELHLIGQMIDRAEVTITETDVRLVLFKQAD